MIDCLWTIITITTNYTQLFLLHFPMIFLWFFSRGEKTHKKLRYNQILIPTIQINNFPRKYSNTNQWHAEESVVANESSHSNWYQEKFYTELLEWRNTLLVQSYNFLLVISSHFWLLLPIIIYVMSADYAVKWILQNMSSVSSYLFTWMKYSS